MKTSLSQSSELSGLNDDEVKRIASVIERDFKLRQREYKRIQEIKKVIQQEQDRIEYLTHSKDFNNTICIRCFKTFKIFFNPKKICSICKLNVCQQCSTNNLQTNISTCKICLQFKELEILTADWFYNEAKKKFKRCGSAKTVRELYKRDKEHSDLDDELGYNTLKKTFSTDSSTSYVIHDKNLQNELNQYSKRLLFLIENLQADVSPKTRHKGDLNDDQQLMEAEICRARTALSGPLRRLNKQLSLSYETDLQNLILQKTEEILHINLQQFRKNENTENFDQKLAQIIYDNYVKKEILTNSERQSLVPTTRTNFSSLGFETKNYNDNFRRMSLLRTPAVEEEDTEKEEEEERRGNLTSTKNLNEDHDQHSMDIEFENLEKSSERVVDWKTNIDLIESKTVSSDSDEPQEYTTWL